MKTTKTISMEVDDVNWLEEKGLSLSKYVRNKIKSDRELKIDTPDVAEDDYEKQYTDIRDTMPP